ncbi:A24 family peptidase [Halocatena marina]|uniref:A24 family peptidase n=1 Tax=Halocatena marina TaxID=2934937 RepID=UPI00200FE3FD|nr:A24 family peptidase [Halocatena marina]
MFVSIPDLLRFVTVPVFAWAAYQDVRTRRVPNCVWVPLVAVGLITLTLDGRSVIALSSPEIQSLFFLRVGVSLGVVAPLGYAVWRLGGFGGADAKAIVTLAVVFPTYPEVYVRWTAIPLEPSAVGVFSLTILTNTALISAAIPLVLAGRNAINGRCQPTMFVGWPVSVDRVANVHGQLLQKDGTQDSDSDGLDIDAVRMYLRWRGSTLEAVRQSPATHRDPTSIPTTPNDPGDGSVAEYDERLISSQLYSETRRADRQRIDDREIDAAASDAWGVAAFFADIDGDAYGSTPAQLRAGLELLSSSETESVWVSPGIPFLVVVFFGLLTALTYGDLLASLLQLIGIV